MLLSVFKSLDLCFSMKSSQETKFMVTFHRYDDNSTVRARIAFKGMA